MKVKVAAKAGFCFGVKRAVEMARKCLHDRDGPVYTLGPLIHNDQVIGALAREGINVVNDLDEITGPGTVIIRSHGVVPCVYQRAEQKGLNLVDATCPFVRKVQNTVNDLVKQDIPVVVVGDPLHPEVQGIIGWSDGRALVVADAGQAEKLDKFPKLGVVAQTTQRQDNFEQVISVLKKNGSRVQVYNTICLATAERQREAMELAQEVDAVLVLGGKTSANTAKLAQICRTAGKPVYQVETAEEIDFAWLKGLRSVGVTAGASTPGWIIEEVCCRMMDFEENVNEETMETQVEEQQPEAESEPQEDMNQEMEDAVEVKNLRNGDIVTGVVVQVNQEEVLVDVGAKSEGVVPIRELSNFNVDSPQDIVKVGDEIKVYVLKSEDNEGRVILSKEKADAEEAWARLEENMNEGQVVSGTVREVVKGGLLVDVGVRAFLPASLVDRGYVEDLSKYLNMDIEAKVIELNRARRKVILSRKAVLEEEYARNRENLLANLEEGQVIRGIVRRLTNFGAFVDIGGVDGLLHISEMAWYRINHPSEVVQVGDELDVKVLRVDRENEKVSLGLKQVLANPWDNVAEKYPVGSIINAKVVRLAPFGAFVQLEPGVEGLVHISHLADRHVATPDEVVQEGEEIRVKVLSVASEEKRIRLSIREVDHERPSKPIPRENQPKKQEVQPANDGGTVTIGDLVGDIFEKQE
ncbi:bifunctional 4-hydroxy-3-methylbut-2-enyl diphosphate reductase/30S ribosomal protein S1 [Sporotomaculum syntrophicum]|nr:bifunctional 4-hydroxy-3-methylbut-2-enyl diphosphate reductase/30S ribosomal protein S1 [Sporotomaculum syntrophicum]